MDASYQASLEEKIKDDKDFLKRFGSTRTPVATKAYKDGWDRIFGKNKAQSTDADSVVTS